MTLYKRNWLIIFASIIITIAFAFVSCQKELSGNGATNVINNEPPDLSTRITSTVEGFVTDENDAALEGAVVKAGDIISSTDKFGHFKIYNASLVKNAAVVTVTKPGYFDGIKTFIGTANHGAFFRIKLIPKTIVGYIDASSGGTVSLSNGIALTLPAGAVVNAATNASYSGAVSVAMFWINPTAQDIGRIMPGDLRGIDTDNSLKLLSSFSMSAVELTGSSGELLQIATGKKANIQFPIPNSLLSSAPAAIPLWYFDEKIGLWKEQGSAAKQGSKYIGDVSHFSYWNCDIKLENSVAFELTVVDAKGNPITSADISVLYANGQYTGAHGLTDSSGHIKGMIPANAQLIIEITNGYDCTGPSAVQNITTSTVDLSLGTIIIGENSTASIIGSVTDCTNAPVSNGYLVVQRGRDNFTVTIKPDGTFSIDMLICGGSSTPVTIIAINMALLQQSSPITQTIAGGSNDVGVINACGITTQEFINYNINGVDYALSAPAATLNHFVELDRQYVNVYEAGTQNRGVSFSFSSAGIDVGSSQNLLNFFSNDIVDSALILTPIKVNITEYGNVGEFIAGNFTGTLTGAAPANTPYIITSSFRIRRKN